MPTPTVIIVPGAWHVPQHYTNLTTRLSKHNYTATAVSLPSVNSSPPLPSSDEDVRAVCATIMHELDNGKDVVALAHSFGGIIMSEAVKGLGKDDRREKGLHTGVLRLVYMCAMALPEGQTHVGQMVPATAAEEEIQKERTEYGAKHGGVVQMEDGAITLPKDAVRDIFYNRCDPEAIEEALDLLGSFPPGPFSVPATYTAYLEIPSTYIVCENDRALSPPIQERMIAQGKGAFHVERCQEGHSPFLSDPEFVVGCIRRAAGEDV